MNKILNLINKNPGYSLLIVWTLMMILFWIKDNTFIIWFSLIVIIFQLDMIINKENDTINFNTIKFKKRKLWKRNL